MTSSGLKGHAYYTSPSPDPINDPIPDNGFIYNFLNHQEAAPLFFHDHPLGALRLNLYAGIVGVYVLEDPAIIPTADKATGVWVSTAIADPPIASCEPASGNCLPANLPGSAEIVPVIIQDRMFDDEGQYFWPANSAGGIQVSPNPEHPYWVPDFFGDTIVVNGKAWPYLEVEPKRYRLLIINGSHSRIYKLKLRAPMWVIGTDDGYVDAPIKVDHLLIASGERYEVIIDFKDWDSTNLILFNTAEAPYPNGTAPDSATLGHVMQFRVGTPGDPDLSYDPASGTPLRPGTQASVRLVNSDDGTLAVSKKKVALTRQLTFNDVMGTGKTVTNPVTGEDTTYPGGRLQLLLNNTQWSGKSDRPWNDFTPITQGGVTNYYSEIIREGDLEVWEFINLTQVSHAQHLHGISFQVLNRQEFNKGAYMTAYEAAFPGGAYIPGFGPPRRYDKGDNGKRLGGNPNIKSFLQGDVLPPRPEEAGWKDTVITKPGQVTRVAVRYAPTELPIDTEAKNRFFPFDPSGEDQFGFVHHCHMTEHEDNEMMRISLVTVNPKAPAPGDRLLKKGVDY